MVQVRPFYRAPVTHAAIFTHTRSGGGLLTLSLNSHPRIIFDTARPWWRGIGNQPDTDVSFSVIVNMLMNRYLKHYRVSGTKLMLDQVEGIRDGWWVERDVKITRLHRENVMRCVVASWGKEVSASGNDFPAEIGVDQFLDDCALRLERMRALDDKVDRLEDGGLDVLRLTYADMVGVEGRIIENIQKETGERLCDFLGVGYRTLRAPRVGRNHPYGMKEMVSNWGELRSALIDAGYEAWVREDEAYFG